MNTPKNSTNSVVYLPIFPEDLQRELSLSFIKTVADVATDNGISLSCVDFCQHELAFAMKECRKDLDAMAMRRRGLSHLGGARDDFAGLSLGKLAGILMFRLARYRIISVNKEIFVDKKLRRLASKLQEIAALVFICHYILKIKMTKQYPELLYVVSRRHTNQEMLGVMFDVISDHCPRISLDTPLDQSPFDRIYRRA